MLAPGSAWSPRTTPCAGCCRSRRPSPRWARSSFGGAGWAQPSPPWRRRRAGRWWAGGPVPVLRHPAVGAGHRRHHRRPGAQRHPGPGGRPRGRHRDPHGERRSAPATWNRRVRVVRPDARPGRLPGAGAPPARHRVDHGPHRRGWPTPGRGGDGRQPRPTAGPCCGPACPTCSTRPRAPAWPSSATTCPSASKAWRPAAATAWTTRLGVPPGADRVGAARHPDPHGGPRLRPRGRTCGPRTAACSRTASQSTIVRMMPPEMLEEMAPARRREARLTHGQAPAGGVWQHPVMQRYGMTIPFDRVPLHDQRDAIVELVDTPTCGRPRPTAPTPTPLALASDPRRRCAWAPPSCPPTPGAGPPGPERRVAGPGGSGPLRARRGHLVRDRRGLERHPVRPALPAHPRRRPLPARRLDRREGLRGVRDLLGAGVPAGRWPPEPVPILVAALREACCGWPAEGDGAIVNWLSADDVSRGAHRARGGKGEPREIVAHLRRRQRRRRRGAGDGQVRDRAVPERAVYAAPHEWLGRGSSWPTCGGCGRRATARPRSPPSPTRWSTS